jgi:hypothetical protein
LETHLLKVESPTFWREGVLCTSYFHTVCAFIL